MISTNLRHIRQTQRLSQAQLAERATTPSLRITQSRISDLEQGIAPRSDELAALALALNVNAEALSRPIAISTAGAVIFT